MTPDLRSPLDRATDRIEALIAERDAAVAEIAALRSRDAWLPIESAPRDGSEVLGWQPEFESVLISWDPYWDGAKGAYLARATNDDCTTWWPISGLTHWRMLPPPPEIVP